MQESDDNHPKSTVAPEEAESLNKKDAEVAKKHENEKFTMSRLLHSRQLRLPLFIAMFLQVIQQLSGINAVMPCPCRLQLIILICHIDHVYLVTMVVLVSH